MPYGAAKGGKDPQVYSLPGSDTNRAQQRPYRPDIGAYMTDAEYAGQRPRAQAPQPQQQMQPASVAPRPAMQALVSGGTPSASTGPTYQEQWAREDMRRAEDLKRKDTILERIQGMFGGESPRVSRTDGPSAEQESASRDAAFARAKETAGQNARASMAALDDVVADRGLMGSSVEGARAGAIVGGASGDIGEFLRDQAMSESDRATDVADLEYTGQIQQRGQELQRKQALLGLLSAGGLY